jgi:hypothetical protein
LTDEVPDVRTEAVKLWEEAGKLYMRENENDLKDQMDFLTDEPVHYPPHGMSCTIVFGPTGTNNHLISEIFVL